MIRITDDYESWMTMSKACIDEIADSAAGSITTLLKKGWNMWKQC